MFSFNKITTTTGAAQKLIIPELPRSLVEAKLLDNPTTYRELHFHPTLYSIPFWRLNPDVLFCTTVTWWAPPCSWKVKVVPGPYQSVGPKVLQVSLRNHETMKNVHLSYKQDSCHRDWNSHPWSDLGVWEEEAENHLSRRKLAPPITTARTRDVLLKPS